MDICAENIVVSNYGWYKLTPNRRKTADSKECYIKGISYQQRLNLLSFVGRYFECYPLDLSS